MQKINKHTKLPFLQEAEDPRETEKKKMECPPKKTASWHGVQWTWTFFQAKLEFQS